MDDIIKIMEQFIQQSKETYKKWPYAGRAKAQAWKVCVALMNDGWTCNDGDNIDGSNSLKLVWKKPDMQDRIVVLSFLEQQLWLKYLEKNFNKTNRVTK